ncbi:hypothetical protein VTH06DRAFT_6583 [Thermothelomyces fergusii]
MDVIVDYLDPLFLDDAYGAASRLLAESTCLGGMMGSHNNNHGSSSSSSSITTSTIATFIDGSSRRLCGLATDPGLWERQRIWRQGTTIFLLTWLSSSLFYLLFGTVCYCINFDRAAALRKQPRFRPGQVRAEMAGSLRALLVLNVLTVPIFVAQVRGLAKIYPFGAAGGWYEAAQYPLFVLFSDTCMYWMHRAFHHPLLFRIFHHKHHRYVVPTPFSAYAFDPIEAWIMSLPIYAYSFLFPMSDVGQLVVFMASNIWTFLLHDDRDQFHTVHHKSVELNFGQFLDLWDRLGGTYADPVLFFQRARGKGEQKAASRF